MKILFVFVFMSSLAFGQSKKKQIESLNKRLDSLNYVLEIERKLYKEQIDKANQNLKEENKKSTDKITKLNRDITILKDTIRLNKVKYLKQLSELKNKTIINDSLFIDSNIFNNSLAFIYFDLINYCIPLGTSGERATNLNGINKTLYKCEICNQNAKTNKVNNYRFGYNRFCLNEDGFYKQSLFLLLSSIQKKEYEKGIWDEDYKDYDEAPGYSDVYPTYTLDKHYDYTDVFNKDLRGNKPISELFWNGVSLSFYKNENNNLTHKITFFWNDEFTMSQWGFEFEVLDNDKIINLICFYEDDS